MNKEHYHRVLTTLKPYCGKNIRKAALQSASTVLFLYTSIFLSFILYPYAVWYSILLIPVTAVFLCRHFVLLHDAGHKSLFHTKKMNHIAGNIFAFPIFIPYAAWSYIHNSHHSHVGNLDKRDMNPEIWTMTVKEYQASSMLRKIAYRFIRSRFARFLVSPWLIFGLIFRIPNPKFNRAANISVIIYDVLYSALFLLLLKYITFLHLLFIYILPLLLFFTIASYVFYAQHQFEDTYWENEENWSFEEAAYKSSTYLLAPKWMNWVSGNVGFHNIHHLISAIPNYNLASAQMALSEFTRFQPISIYKVPSLFKYKLWDEEKKKMVPIPK